MYVLRLQNYQVNIKSHMKVHKITDDPDCVLCDNTTGQWGTHNRTPEYVIWYVQRITKRKTSTETTSQYVLNSLSLMVRLHRQRFAEAKRSEVIHFQWELVIWADVTDSYRQRHNTSRVELSSVTRSRAVTWCGDFECLYPGTHFHIDRHSHHREVYCYSLVSSHTVHDEVNCRESLSSYN